MTPFGSIELTIRICFHGSRQTMCNSHIPLDSAGFIRINRILHKLVINRPNNPRVNPLGSSINHHLVRYRIITDLLLTLNVFRKIITNNSNGVRVTLRKFNMLKCEETDGIP